MPTLTNEIYWQLVAQAKKKMRDLCHLMKIMELDGEIGPMIRSDGHLDSELYNDPTISRLVTRSNGFKVYLYRNEIIAHQLCVEISKASKDNTKLDSIVYLEVPIMQVDHRFIKWVDVIADSCHHDGTRTRGSLDVSRSCIKSKNEINRVIISSQKNRYHGLTNEEEIIELIIGMYEDVFKLNNSKRLSNGHIALFRNGEKSVRDYIKKSEGSDCQGSSFKMS